MTGYRFRLLIVLALFLGYCVAAFSIKQYETSLYAPEGRCMTAAISYSLYGAPLSQAYWSLNETIAKQVGSMEGRLQKEVSAGQSPADLRRFVDDGNGIGCPIYASLGMKLFGPHVTSLYYFGMLLMGISALIFCLRFKGAEMIAPAATFAALTCMLATPLSYEPNVPDQMGLFGLRYSFVIALIPGFHLLLEIFSKRRNETTSGREYLFLALQMVIFVLIVLMRGSPIYLLMAAIICSGFLMFVRLCKKRPFQEMARLLAVILLLYSLTHALFAMSVSREYRETERLHGGVWHRAAASLSQTADWPYPEFLERYFCTPEFPTSYKNIGMDQVAHYLWLNDPSNASLLFLERVDGMFTSHYEATLRHSIFELAKARPIEMFWSFAGKTHMLDVTFYSFILNNHDFSGNFSELKGIIVMQLGLFLIIMLHLAGRYHWRTFAIYPCMMLGYYGLAYIPNFIAWTAIHTSVDLIFYLHALILFIAALVAAMLFSLGKRIFGLAS